MYNFCPGETIKELLETNKITENEFSNLINLNIENVSKLLNGNLIITNELALKLENVFNIPTSFWINLEKNYIINKKN